MVEFRFDIRPLFPQPIVRVTSNLLPHTFRGDRRQALDTTSKMSEIIDRLGQLSANAQKLTKPVTTAQRLRMSSNQTIYLLADIDAGKNGAVVGLLKVGTKDLYLFDEVGQTRKVENAACILDFYVHESRQRSGLGKELFETMLEQERWQPVKCSVDRPSEKLLGFLAKHYGLTRSIPQANNFVLYEGFFESNVGQSSANGHQQLLGKQQQHATNGGMYITNSPNTQLLGAHYLGDDAYTRRQRQLGQHNNNINHNNINGALTQISPVGRYGARRPTGSMAEIIHNDVGPRNSGSFTNSATAAHTSHEMTTTTQAIEKLTEDMQSMQTTDTPSETHILDLESEPPLNMQDMIDEAAVAAAAAEEMRARAAEAEAYLVEQQQQQRQHEHEQATSNTMDTIIHGRKPLPTFQLSKQHTGMKNISFGVGMAVTPTTKMEFDQEAREEFGVVKINRPIGKLKSPPPSQDPDNMSTISSGEGLTDQGYYDLKFYHNKLW